MGAFIPIIIIAIVFFSAVSNANKRQKEQQERARRVAASVDAVNNAAPPSRTYTPVRDAYSGSMDYESSEGRAVSASVEGSSIGFEGSSDPATPPLGRSTMVAAGGSDLRHDVKPITESSHSHTESSITGFTECEVDNSSAFAAAAAEAVTVAADAAYDIELNSTTGHILRFDHSSVVQGFIYGEILSKPRARRCGIR
ncbi:MAG: hypothetical protein RR232_04950 [Clostridia bacterium]